MSEFEMDDEMFSFYMRRACKNVHKYYLLAQLLPNANLTERQFNEVVKVLDRAYFKKGLLWISEFLLPIGMQKNVYYIFGFQTNMLTTN